MKIVLIMCILEEQETYLLRAVSNHSVSCGSVVPCVETSRLKSQQQGMSSSEANELVATSGSQKKVWISWKDKSKELIDEKIKESQYKQT